MSPIQEWTPELGKGRPQPPRTRKDGKPSRQQHAYGRPSTLLVFRKGRS